MKSRITVAGVDFGFNLVCSGYMVEDEKVLLVHHNRFDKWVPPGGHIEAGETFAEAAEREFQEETGIYVDVVGAGSEIHPTDSNARALPLPFYIDLELEGFAVPTMEEATDKALLEALGLLESALDMHDPEGGFWRTYMPGQGNGAVRAVRSDRRYLDSYRSDFRDVTDLFCQLQVQLDPRSASTVRSRLDGAPTADLSALPRFPARDHRAYVDALSRAGFEPLEVDLTTPDVAAAGWHVRRVVIPGLVPNFPTAFPPLGRGRLSQLLATLGWRTTPLATSELWTFPMPYA